MKKPILLFFIILCGSILNAQNLVQNPSFEEYDTCPNNISQVNFLKYWREYRPTADFFNSCSSSNYVSAPYNMSGYQCPANGNSYCGFWVYHSSINNLREYIGCNLINPLIINTKYFISVKFNLSNSANCAINKIGILFTTQPHDTNYLSVTNYAHLYSQTIINDTMNWTTISGSFIADSSYKYIVIGKFFKDSLTDTLHISENTCLSYYLVDDVCVSTDSLTCVIPNGDNICDTGVNISETILNKELYVIYPNPTNGQIFIDLPYVNEATINIYNLLGQLMLVKSFLDKKIAIDLSEFENGIYILQINQRDQIYNKKIIIQKP